MAAPIESQLSKVNYVQPALKLRETDGLFLINNTTSPARGRRCNYCHQYGHFRSVCRRASSRSATPIRGRNTMAATNNVDSDTDSQTDETSLAIGSMYIGMVSSTAVMAAIPTEADSVFVDSVTSYYEPGTFKIANCRVGNVPLDLLIDLGAKVSIINRKFYERHLSHRFKLY